MEKGTFGYIDCQRRKQFIKALLSVAAAAGIFILGLALNKWDKKNIFSIFAVLMMLPAAKIIVGYIVLIRFHSPDEAKYQELASTSAPNMILLSDLVITSTEKVMNLDFIFIVNGSILGMAGRKGQDIAYIATYLERTLKNNKYSYAVKIYDNYPALLNRIKSAKKEEIISKTDESVKKLILTLCV